MTALGRVGRPLGLAATWAVGGFVLAVLIASAAPLALGDRSYVVRSGSMSPAIDTGDVVVVEPIAALDAQVGDIVTFEDSAGRLITHRARAISRKADMVQFTTQGDANTVQEHWEVPAAGEVGRVVYRVPKLGYAVAQITTPAGRIGLLVVPALLLAGSALRRIWRPEPSPERCDELAS